MWYYVEILYNNIYNVNIFLRRKGMKKSNSNKLLALILCVTMVFGLVACGTKKEVATDATATTEESTVEATTEEAAATVEETAKEETTLTAFIQQSVTSESGIWQGWGAQKLYDDTKIKVDFAPTGNEVEQRLQQYLVSGSMPDIIGFKGLDQAQLAMDADMVLNLSDYKELLPNLFENEGYQDAIAYSEKYTSNDTGNLLLMPTAIGPASINAYNWVPLLQWDAYKQIGMPEINTLEDYLDVVEKMVAIKPETENGEKVYGFSLFSDWDKYTALEVSTLSFFYGIDTEYVSHLMETNVTTKETTSILDENSFYKRALKFYFDANQRGLLDPDSATQTYSNVDAKYSAGRVMFSYFSWMTGTYNTPEAGNVNNEESADGYASVLASDMKLYDAPDQTIGRNWYFAISKDCKDIERACELLNWLYSPDVEQYLYNGPEGGIWNYSGTGEPQVTDPDGWNVVDKKTEPIMPAEGGGSLQDGTYAFNTLGMQASTVMDNGYTISYRYWPTTLTRNPTLMKQEVNAMLGADTLADYLNANNMVAKSTQAVNMIPTISDEMEMTVSQIGEIVKKYSWQMIFAKDESEFNSLWEKMVEESKGLGIDSITEYYKQAWTDALNVVKEYE
jgi:putative aldouronate transport system substrate-binding protein